LIKLGKIRQNLIGKKHYLRLTVSNSKFVWRLHNQFYCMKKLYCSSDLMHILWFHRPCNKRNRIKWVLRSRQLLAVWKTTSIEMHVILGQKIIFKQYSLKNTHTSVKSHPMSLRTPHRPMMEIINSPIPMAKSIWGVVMSSVLMKFDHLYSLWLMMNAMDRIPTLEIWNLCRILLIIH